MSRRENLPLVILAYYEDIFYEEKTEVIKFKKETENPAIS
jgi:hypothetical protein